MATQSMGPRTTAKKEVEVASRGADFGGVT